MSGHKHHFPSEPFPPFSLSRLGALLMLLSCLFLYTPCTVMSLSPQETPGAGRVCVKDALKWGRHVMTAAAQGLAQWLLVALPDWTCEGR